MLDFFHFIKITGNYNTAIGYNTQTAITTGGNNVSLGNNAIAQKTTGHYNVGIGNTSPLANLHIGTPNFNSDGTLIISKNDNIKLFLDADEGLNVQKSVSINRQLVAQIDELGWYPNGDYSLEVSSPGVDEPLRSIRQYKKNIGRTLAVTNIEDLEQIGVLKAVTEVGISLEVKINKKKETALVELPFENIKQSIVQVIF